MNKWDAGNHLVNLFTGWNPTKAQKWEWYRCFGKHPDQELVVKAMGIHYQRHKFGTPSIDAVRRIIHEIGEKPTRDVTTALAHDEDRRPYLEDEADIRASLLAMDSDLMDELWVQFCDRGLADRRVDPFETSSFTLGLFWAFCEKRCENANGLA